MFEFQSVRRSFPRNLAENSEAASFLGQTTSYQTEVQEREPWDFYEMQWKTQMHSEYFFHYVLAGNINHWKNITADGLFRKNGTTTIWIWKHWNNFMVNNCSYSIFPNKNNNHIFYDYSEINQKGPQVKINKKCFLYAETYYMLRFAQIRNTRNENRLIFLLLANKNIVFP